ncbi:MAG TPA: MBL fold metallo-hydrolase [Phycisphaerae bacterium]|nr:MBL fold metallo-hydrolase [Phycisphaerales bacterium]HRX84946.1 MBL fold metallo-hydrolase [Phycisphaerae bacterium]
MATPEVFIKVFNDPFYAENGLVLALGAEGRPCWIVDPGLPPEAEEMLAYVAERRLTPTAIVLTHAHGDHIAGVDEIRNAHAGLPVYLAKGEWKMLGDAAENLSAQFGVEITARTDHLHDLAPGDVLELDGSRWEVRDSSGHSPAGRTLYCAELKLALVGDAVFAGSIGRTDFHHSDGDRLVRNIRANILTLPDDVTLISGHGPATTVGQERATNPFLRG